MTRPFIFQPLLLTAFAQADPRLTSWFTRYSGKFSRVYTTMANRNSGTSATPASPAMDSYGSPDSTSRYPHRQHPMNTQTATGPVAAAILLCMETYFPQHCPADEPAAE